MSKQWLVYGGVGLAIGVSSIALGAFVLSLRRNTGTSIASPVTQLPLPGARNQSETMETYSDESGFSFQYPSSLTVTDETPGDDSYYSMVSLKDPDGAKMTMKVRDDSAASTPKTVGQPVSVRLGTLDGKQYQGNGKLTTIATDQGVLYMIESILDGGYWEKAHRGIVSTFAFTKPQAESRKTSKPSSGSSVSPSGDDVVYETEEVVE